MLARLIARKREARPAPRVVVESSSKLDRELRKEYQGFVREVEGVNDRLAQTVFEHAVLDSERDRRLLSLHLRRKSNDEKKHWLPLQRPQPLPSKETRTRATAGAGPVEIRYDQERLERMLEALRERGQIGGEEKARERKEGGALKVDRLLQLGRLREKLDSLTDRGDFA